MTNLRRGESFAALCCCCLLACGAALAEQPSSPGKAKPKLLKVEKNPQLDHSGKVRQGKASYYGPGFHGKPMADGTPFNPRSNAAASRTLPLGTRAVVTNLENGKSAEVEIRDRGPYIEGRIVDVTPRTAEKLDMKTDGVVAVEVTPIEVPMPDGSVRAGAAAEQDRPTETASNEILD